MEYTENKLRNLCRSLDDQAITQFDFALAHFRGLLPDEKLRRIDRIILSGCGDSYLACVEALQAFSFYLGDGCQVMAPGIIEATRYLPLEEQEPNTLIVAVSAGGGSARVVELLERGKKHGCMTVALTHNAESRVAKAADYIYLTKIAPDAPGLGSYYASMLSLLILAAVLSEVRSGDTKACTELLEALLEYHVLFMRRFDRIDEDCQAAAEEMKSAKGFEVIADGPQFACAEFVSAKFAEASGDKCTVIDSENFFHVNNMIAPELAYGTMLLAWSDEANIGRIADAAMFAYSKGRYVFLICDKEPSEVGISAPVGFCRIPLPREDYRFLGLLYAYIPGTLLASYRAVQQGSAYFGTAEKVDPSVFTIATSEIIVI